MKNTLLLVILLFCCFAGQGATISGYVYYAHTTRNVPMCNKVVYIVDSSASFYQRDSVLTEFDGSYSYTVPSGSSGRNLRLYIDVNINIYNSSQTVSYSGSSISGIDFFATFTTPTYPLWGTVTLGGLAATGPIKLYLISKKYDPAVMDTTLTAIDSFYTIGTTGNFHKAYASSVYTLSNGGANALLVKAALMPGHPSYASYLPAYASGSLTWNGARRMDSSSNVVQPATGSQFFMANIDLPAGVNPGGNGFIGGSVMLGANRTSGVGDPLPGKMLILTTMAGQPVGFTYSGGNGTFSFSRLAAGNYKLFGDAWGKNNPPLAVTVSAAAPSVNNIVFEENSSEFKGRYSALGTGTLQATTPIVVYPNPACGDIQLKGLSGIEGTKHLALRDVRGVLVATAVIAAGATGTIPTASLPAGTYSIELQTSQGASVYSFVRQ